MLPCFLLLLLLLAVAAFYVLFLFFCFFFLGGGGHKQLKAGFHSCGAFANEQNRKIQILQSC